jgi:hypothetical protein
MTTSPRAEISKSLFGNKHRLDVAAAIGEYGFDEQFYAYQVQTKLEDEYGTPPSRTAQEIQLFTEFDLIKRVSDRQQPKFKAVYFERVDSWLMECLIGVADWAIQRTAGS